MIFSLSQITEPEELKTGMELFLVKALGKNSFVERLTVTGQPYMRRFLDGSESLFVPAVQHYWDSSHGRDISTKDQNIGRPNGYNRHKAFFDRDAAVEYMDNCMTLNIGAR